MSNTNIIISWIFLAEKLSFTASQLPTPMWRKLLGCLLSIMLEGNGGNKCYSDIQCGGQVVASDSKRVDLDSTQVLVLVRFNDMLMICLLAGLNRRY